MTLPCFVWMLSECGHVSALPRGTSSVDALPTGPVYELVLRSQPSVKLLYNHKATSNVNETASNLAGHTVNGDACLVFSPTPSSFASPALLLNSLLRPAAAAARQRRQHGQRPKPRPSYLRLNASAGNSPSQQLPDCSNPRRSSLDWPAACESAPPTIQSLDWSPGPPLVLAGPQPGSAASDQQGQRTAAVQIGGSPLQDSGISNSTSSSTNSCPMGGRQPRHRWLNAAPCPQERQQAMRAILGSRNASGGAAAASASGGDGIAAPAGPPAVDPIAVPSRCTRRPTDVMAQLQEPPCKSARSSGEFHPHRRGGSLPGADPWVTVAAPELVTSTAFPGAPLPAAVVRAAADQLAGILAVAAQEGMGRVSCAAEQPMECPACMELDDAADGSLAAGEIVDVDAEITRGEPGMLGNGPRGRSWPGAGQDRLGLMAGRAVDGGTDTQVEVAGGRVTGAAGDNTQAKAKAEGTNRAAAAEAAAAGVAWAELAGDAVVCIAQQLPQQASQAMAMAGVCRGWRAALLGHSLLLRRLAFTLDLTHPLRTSRTAPAHPPSPSPSPATPSSPPGSGSTTSVAPPVPVDVAALSPQQTRRLSIQEGGSGPAPSWLPSRAAATHVEDDLRSRGLDEGQVLAAAMAQQHAAGAFLLASLGQRPHDGRVPEPGAREPVTDGGPAAAASAVMAAAPGPAPSPGVVSELRGAVRSWLPKLLLAAAHAGNPSAQLLMAQLLEATDDARGSLRWWRKLAQVGDLMAMFKVGIAMYDGSHGLQPDPEAAHLWLGRTVRKVLQVDSLSAICLDGHQAGGRAAGAAGAAAAAATSEWDVRRMAGPEQQRQRGSRPHCGRVGPALQAAVAALDAPRLHMLAWSSIVLGYLEFDGVAGRAVWGMGERSEAVRLFRLAEACGLAEASAVLGWLYNTGQY